MNIQWNIVHCASNWGTNVCEEPKMICGHTVLFIGQCSNQSLYRSATKIFYLNYMAVTVHEQPFKARVLQAPGLRPRRKSVSYSHCPCHWGRRCACPLPRPVRLALGGAPTPASSAPSRPHPGPAGPHHPVRAPAPDHSLSHSCCEKLGRNRGFVGNRLGDATRQVCQNGLRWSW